MRPAGVAAALLAWGTAGCFHVDYVAQAAEGQLDLLCRSRSLDEAMASPDLDDRSRGLLAEVPGIKRFAESRGLTPTESYERFVALDAPYVVWVVSAAPPLSLEAVTWTFPFAGEVPYLGWFDRELALGHARALEAEGLDVDVRGASAYSTLGWFPDPVLSSMLEAGDEGVGLLADTVLHESVHATVYVLDQPDFNESLATFVGERLARVYLSERFGPESSELEAWARSDDESRAIRERLEQAHAELSALYASSRSDRDKLAEKRRVLDGLERELELSRPINNAVLTAYEAYHGGEQALARALAGCSGDLGRLVGAAKTLSAGDFTEPQQTNLQPIADRLIEVCAR